MCTSNWYDQTIRAPSKCVPVNFVLGHKGHCNYLSTWENLYGNSYIDIAEDWALVVVKRHEQKG